MTPLTIDTITHIVEIASFLGIAWKGIRALNRFGTVLKDFPPHRHVNGNILYPNDYLPSTVEKLGDSR